MKVRIYHALPGGYRHVLADMATEGCEAWGVELVTQENDSGQLSLTISEDNPEFSGLVTMRSEVIAMRDEVELWRGRIIRQESQKPWSKKLVCKGILDYLYDVVLMPQTLSGAAQDVIGSILDQFNASAEYHKQFSVGQISAFGQIEHEIKKPTKAFAVLSEIVKEVGGCMFSRRDGEKNLLDWLLDEDRPVCSQRARWGDNVSSLKVSTDAEDLATVLYGYGKNDISFASVNGGKAYVEDPDAVEQFGRIEDAVSLSKISDPNELLAATKKELESRLSKGSAIEASVIDRSWIDDTVEAFTVDKRSQLVVPVFGIDEVLPIKKIVCPLFRPFGTKITLGASFKTASSIMIRGT